MLSDLWGDDGAYCEFDSSLAGLAYGAEIAYSGAEFPPKNLSRRYAALCGSDYEMVLAAGDMNRPTDFLWDDPLLGICWKNERLKDPKAWTKYARKYEGVLKKLAPVRKIAAPVDFAHIVNVAELYLAKIRLRGDLEKAYAACNRAGLKAVCAQAKKVIAKIDAVLASFRRQWYRHNKPQGFEAIQLRLGGQKQRYEELAQRISELLDGTAANIPELEEQPTKPGIPWCYANIASGSVII